MLRSDDSQPATVACPGRFNQKDDGGTSGALRRLHGYLRSLRLGACESYSVPHNEPSLAAESLLEPNADARPPSVRCGGPWPDVDPGVLSPPEKGRLRLRPDAFAAFLRPLPAPRCPARGRYLQVNVCCCLVCVRSGTQQSTTGSVPNSEPAMTLRPDCVLSPRSGCCRRLRADLRDLVAQQIQIYGRPPLSLAAACMYRHTLQ